MEAAPPQVEVVLLDVSNMYLASFLKNAMGTYHI